MSLYMVDQVNPTKIERVLQYSRGGSLEAYEPGVFHILYQWNRKYIKKMKMRLFLI